MVGPFFWIDGKILAFPNEPNDADDPGTGIIDGKAGHATAYERTPYQQEHDYDYWPRGRVVFDKNKNRSIVYLDRCIKNDEAVRSVIVDSFHLDPKKTSWKLDGHYKCHRCDPNYLDFPPDDLV